MNRSRKEVLRHYADPKFKVPENWTTDELTMVEAKRLSRFGMMACYASTIPRRLGSDASSTELSADKKLSKKIAWVYLNLWQRYTLSAHAPLPIEECPAELVPPANWNQYYAQAAADEDIRTRGAAVLWEPWWEDVRPRVLARRMMYASYACNVDAYNWGYRICTGLTDEVGWIDRKIAKYQETIGKAVA